MNKSISLKWLLLIALTLVTFPLGCKGQTTVPPTTTYSAPELEYRLIANFGDVFWCDPDFYPIAREGAEEANAQVQFPLISANTTEFSAILAHLGLPVKAEYSDADKLAIYREHKKLVYMVQMTPSRNLYDFTLRVGENQGERINGTITTAGVIKVLKREPSFNTCPICLAEGTLIDSPGGQIPVEQLRKGMAVWTADTAGKRVQGTVVETAMTPVPPSFELVRLTLSDGRTVTASPGHPTAEQRQLGDYNVGEILNGAPIVSLAYEAYDGGATYDILPSGDTGLYLANGILLKSTMAKH